jgi:hypothetical protein
VAALCRALDGMALAIELAAARFAALGSTGWSPASDQRLRLLTAGTGGRPPRLAARGRRLELRPAPPADRALLRGMRVFASWFDVDAARAVAGAAASAPSVATAGRLAEHSLLVVERGEPTRYGRWRRSASTASRRLDQAGELDGSGRPRAVVPARVAALGRDAHADLDEAGAPGSTDRRRRRRRAHLVAGDEQRRSLAAELAAGCRAAVRRGRPAQAQRATSRPPSSPRRARGGAATCGWPPARPPAGSPATTPAAVPGGGGRRARGGDRPARRGTWRRWRCT